MARLRLIKQPMEDPEAPAALQFPAEALAEARARKAAPALRRGLNGNARKLVTRVEAILDDMQRGLDSLKDQVENYRFPGLPPPSDRGDAA